MACASMPAAESAVETVVVNTLEQAVMQLSNPTVGSAGIPHISHSGKNIQSGSHAQQSSP